MIIKGFAFIETKEDAEDIADGYVIQIADGDNIFIKQDGEMTEFDKSLLERLFTKTATKKTTKSNHETYA